MRGPLIAVLLLALLLLTGCAADGSSNSSADWSSTNSNQSDLNQITKSKAGGKIW